jgi:hypothetical protein
MFDWLLIAGAPAMPPAGVFIGVTAFAGISAAVVALSKAFSSNDGTGPVPADYDNRWPGYPNRPGDPYYIPNIKGAMGNLPHQMLYKGRWIDGDFTTARVNPNVANTVAQEQWRQMHAASADA